MGVIKYTVRGVCFCFIRTGPPFHADIEFPVRFNQNNMVQLVRSFISSKKKTIKIELPKWNKLILHA